MKIPKIGEISSGTLRPEDLIEVFSRELSSLDPDNDLVNEATNWVEDSEEWDQEEVNDLIARLTDALQELAPDYVRFGAHEGDGACFGFWADIDALDQAVEDGEVLKINAGDEIPPDWTGPVMEVTDHGNVTYKVPTIVHKEVWSCV